MDSGEPQIPPDLKNTVADFRAFLKMELGRSANTVASYTSDVAQFAAFLHARKIESFADVDADSLVEWISGIARNTKASTQSRKLSAMKSLAGFLVDERVWSKNYCDLVARPKLRRNIPEILSAEEVARLLEAPPTDTPEGLRDRAMLELMYSSGLGASPNFAESAKATSTSPSAFCASSAKARKRASCPSGRTRLRQSRRTRRRGATSWGARKFPSFS